MNKKAGVDFIIYSPITLILILIIIFIFGVYFFVFGGAQEAHFIVKESDFPATTARDILNQNEMKELLLETYSEDLKECKKKSLAICDNPKAKEFQEEFTKNMNKLQNEKWLLKVYLYTGNTNFNMFQFYIESEKGVYENFKNPNKKNLKESSLILPLENGNTLEVLLQDE